MTLTPLLALGAWLVAAPFTVRANWGEQTAADLAALELAQDDQAMMATILGDSLNTSNSPPRPTPDQEDLGRPLSSPPLGLAAHDDDHHLAPAAALNDPPQRLHRDSMGISHLGQQPDTQQVIAGSAPLYQ